MTPLTDNEREILALTAAHDDSADFPGFAFETSCALRNKGLIRYHEDKIEWLLTDRGRDLLLAGLLRTVAEQAATIKDLKLDAIALNRRVMEHDRAANLLCGRNEYDGHP